MNFNNFSLHERLSRALVTCEFDTPTPIQNAALPVLLAGNDLVATAQTGTGKTAAFVLPILQHLLDKPKNGRTPRVLILAPTRELCEQIHSTIQILAQHTNIRSATVYGGVGMVPQQRHLRSGIEIIVACPGRLLDHVARANADLSKIEILVLDEADRMLDMGFLPPINKIVGLIPTDRQTMLFSATFAQELQSFVKKALREPQRIDIGISAPAETIEHKLYPVPQHLKTPLLIEMLGKMDTDSVLVFTRTKHRANKVCDQLTEAGYEAGVLHSNKSQNQRQQTLDMFRSGKVRLLVATDIAARGIDVRTISHVVNYDIPDCADAYIHRIGRTGRMEKSGEAITFVTNEDRMTVRDIERALRSSIPIQMVESFDYKREPTKNEIIPATIYRNQQPSNRSARPTSNNQPAQNRAPRPAPVAQPKPVENNQPTERRMPRTERQPAPTNNEPRGQRYGKAPQAQPMSAEDMTAAPSRNERPARNADPRRGDRQERNSDSSRGDRQERSSEPSRSDRPDRNSESSRSDRPARAAAPSGRPQSRRRAESGAPEKPAGSPYGRPASKRPKGSIPGGPRPAGRRGR
jgi:ATP-dependent RNA helicase RhlE